MKKLTDMDEFEQRLSRQTLRDVPSHWKAGIVAASKGRLAEEEKSFFGELFVTLRWGWGVIATIWIILLAVNRSDDLPGYEIAGTNSRRAVETMAQNHKDINQLLAFEKPDTLDAFLRPRSEREISKDILRLEFA